MPALTFHLIPHTHWDREWYLPRGQFAARLIPVVDDLLDLLERNPAIPGFLLDGQTILLEDYLRIRPGESSRVARLVRQGRIETGPWYVLADEQIPSGESLIRNLLLGRMDLSRWGGGLPVLYSPDAFGHPALLPSLAAEFGLDFAVLWRGIRSDTDLLQWEGDGRRILVYHLPPDGYEIGSGLISDPAFAERAWEPVRRALVKRAASPHVAVFIGADHHAARPDLIQLRDSIARLEVDHEVQLSTLARYRTAVSSTTDLPVIAGELRQSGYTWTLQGVHGTRSHLKRRNSRAELWLERFADPLAALSRRQGGRDRRPLLTHAGRTLVQCHFHDAIAGCAADPVARELDVRLAEVEGIAREVVRDSIGDLFGWNRDRARERPEEVQPSLVLWNPVPRSREGIVLAQVTRFREDILVGPPGSRVPRTSPPHSPFSLATEGGDLIPVQILTSYPALERLDAVHHYPDQDKVDLVRIAFEAPAVAGLSGQVLTLVPGESVPAWGGAEAGGNRIANGLLEIEATADGSLAVLDRATGERRVLRVESEADWGDTYTFCPGSTGIGEVQAPVQVRTVAPGPMVAALEIRGSIRVPVTREGSPGGIVSIRMLIMLLRDDPLVRCTLWLDNQAEDHRLRFRFPAGKPGSYATAGGQFGAVRRPPAVDRPHYLEAVAATAPAHRYVGVEGEPGFAFFGPGFFEYELDPQGDLFFTVLRGVGQLSRNDLSTRAGHAGWPTPTPLAQCPGLDALDFGFALGGGTWGDPVRLQEAWESLFLPLKAGWFRDWNGGAIRSESVNLEGEGMVFSTLASATTGEGSVLRCYNLLGREVSGALRFSSAVRRVQRIRADESVLGEVVLSDGGRVVQFTARPREIVTFLIK